MRDLIDYTFKLTVVMLLGFIAYKEYAQTASKSNYSQSVWIEGGEIRAQITNDEKSRIPTTSDLERISLKDNQSLPVTIVNPPLATSPEGKN